MKFEILSEKENDDGSLQLTVELDEEAKQVLLQAGLNAIQRAEIEKINDI